MGSAGSSWQNQNTSGSSNNTANTVANTSSDASTRQVAPDGWADDWNASNPGAGGNADIDYARNYLMGQQDRGSNTLGAWFDAPADVNAQQIASKNVSGQRASQFSDPYKSQYAGVADAALSSFDNDTGAVANQFRLGQLGAGGGGSRGSVAASEVAGQRQLGRAQLESGLKFGGLDKAFALGGQDAGMSQSALTGNADREFGADSTNASNALNAGQFNNTMTNQRQMFDIGQADRGDAMRDQNAMNIAGLGQMGFQQMQDYLTQGRSLFGTDQTSNTDQTSQTDESGTYDQKSKGSGQQAKFGK